MRVIATTHDEGGRQVGREVTDHDSMPITELQARHLTLGLEVSVIRGGQRIDVRRADAPSQRTRQMGAR